MHKNLFGVVMTHIAPSANYRGESENNRSVLQKITWTDGMQYTVISSEAIRNALREMLRGYGLNCNRSRDDTQNQIAVKMEDFPDPERFIDDFYFGYLAVGKGTQPKEQRDSVLLVNLARALTPYRYDSLLAQSPLQTGAWRNSSSSSLLVKEVVATAYQYTFAMNLNDCLLEKEKNAEWFRYLLQAISELNRVAGNHARTYYEMAPASIVLRLTDANVIGVDTYGFTQDGDFPEIVEGILHGDWPGDEFYLGGKIVRNMDEELKTELEKKGAHLYRRPHQALNAISEATTSKLMPRYEGK